MKVTNGTGYIAYWTVVTVLVAALVLGGLLAISVYT